MNDEQIVIVPIPSLVSILLNAENEQGLALSENEVNEMVENCVCLTMPLSSALELELKRGYRDIRPEYAWQDWIEYKNNPDFLNL